MRASIGSIRSWNRYGLIYTSAIPPHASQSRAKDGWLRNPRGPSSTKRHTFEESKIDSAIRESNRLEGIGFAGLKRSIFQGLHARERNIKLQLTILKWQKVGDSPVAVHSANQVSSLVALHRDFRKKARIPYCGALRLDGDRPVVISRIHFDVLLSPNRASAVSSILRD